MRQVFTRPAEERDAAQFAEWCGSNATFDPEVLSYPSTITLAAYNQSGTIAYMPLVMDAVVFRPGITEMDKALAMKELTKTAVFLAHSKGVGEVLFLGSHPETNKFAGKHIFTELPWKVYRAKLRDLEGL